MFPLREWGFDSPPGHHTGRDEKERPALLFSCPGTPRTPYLSALEGSGRPVDEDCPLAHLLGQLVLPDRIEGEAQALRFPLAGSHLP